MNFSSGRSPRPDRRGVPFTCLATSLSVKPVCLAVLAARALSHIVHSIHCLTSHTQFRQQGLGTASLQFLGGAFVFVSALMRPAGGMGQPAS